MVTQFTERIVDYTFIWCASKNVMVYLLKINFITCDVAIFFLHFRGERRVHETTLYCVIVWMHCNLQWFPLRLPSDDGRALDPCVCVGGGGSPVSDVG